MKFVFFRFRRTEKIDSVMKELRGTLEFWARTAPRGVNNNNNNNYNRILVLVVQYFCNILWSTGMAAVPATSKAIKGMPALFILRVRSASWLYLCQHYDASAVWHCVSWPFVWKTQKCQQNNREFTKSRRNVRKLSVEKSLYGKMFTVNSHLG